MSLPSYMIMCQETFLQSLAAWRDHSYNANSFTSPTYLYNVKLVVADNTLVISHDNASICNIVINVDTEFDHAFKHGLDVIVSDTIHIKFYAVQIFMVFVTTFLFSTKNNPC